jgi:flagellar protein FliS
MNYNNITQAYQNAERQALEEMNDPHQIVLTMLDALLKSMRIFVDNIDLKNGGDAQLKSKHFARALTIIYALQSSLDFEKGGDIANNLFQLYEYARQKLISDLGKGVVTDTPSAIDALREIRDAWHMIGDEVKDAK